MKATIATLSEKHGNSYTPMQYRVWAEMHLGGVHPSLDTSPTTTMFSRAGGASSTKKKSGNADVAHVVSAISDLTSALSPGSGTRSSPAKLIDNRTKCYKQLLDLKSLFDSNVLSEEEYSSERSVILGVLNKLVCS